MTIETYEYKWLDGLNAGNQFHCIVLSFKWQIKTSSNTTPQIKASDNNGVLMNTIDTVLIV